MNFIAKALNLSHSAVTKLEERNLLRRALIKHPFFSDVVDAYRLDKKFGYYEEGTVVVKTVDGIKVIRGFPKIRRALLLNPTLKKHFGNRKIALEEKMNGYNVRIVKIGENLYAVTRRGIFCPYTTERVREVIPPDFFDEFSEFMLCCEAVGEASPYVPKKTYGVKDLDFFLFDIRNCRTNAPLGFEEKEETASRFGIKVAPVHAITFPDDTETIREVVRDLNNRGREGIVFKDLKMEVDPIKYTTSFANCSDLTYAFRYFNEYAKDFMLTRIIREAFQSFEFEDSEEEMGERAKRLGIAILKSVVESISEVKRGGRVMEKSKLVFTSYETLELFKQHLKLQGLDFKLEIAGERDGKITVILERIMRGTTDKITGILNGNLWR